jgi:predicted DNA-binding antitoxin AbrB/MazE fold protein
MSIGGRCDTERRSNRSNRQAREVSMSSIEAIYRHGVFEPLEPVQLQDEQRVRLHIEPTGDETLQVWLEQVRTRQAATLKRHGILPDSAPDIAEDRQR